MKKLFNLTLLVSLLFAGSLQAQFNAYKTILSKVSDSTATTPSGYGAIRYNTQGGKNKWQFDNGAGFVDFGSGGGGSMVYPGSGIPLSTGSAWGTSITDNSSNWNTAYGWGDHASAGYWPSSGSYSLTGDFTATLGSGTYYGSHIFYRDIGNNDIRVNFEAIGVANPASTSIYAKGGFEAYEGQERFWVETKSPGIGDEKYIYFGIGQESLALNNGGGELFSVNTLSGKTKIANAFNLPTTAGTNTYVLTTDGAGETSWAAPSGGGLTVGTSTITSGTNTKVLYNNSGVLGEYTVSGTGNVALTTSPVFTTPNIGTATGTASGNYSLASGGTATGTNTFAMGSNPFILTSGVTTGTGATAGIQNVFNSLTTGNGLDISSSSTTTGAIEKITSTSTGLNHTKGSGGLLTLLSSGAYSSSSRTGIGASLIMTNTGTTSTNIPLYVSATGATTNNAIEVGGGDIILSQGSQQKFLKSGGVFNIGVSDYNTLALVVQNTNRVIINGSSGAFTFTTNAVASGSITPYTFNDFARTNQTASTESNFTRWTPSTTQFATGTQSLLRAYRMEPATYSFVGASDITNAYTLWVDKPVASTNATILQNWAAGFDGNVGINERLIVGTSTISSLNDRVKINGVGTTTGKGLVVNNSSGTERFSVQDNGVINVSGSGGTAGQVLVSNGTSAAAWGTPTVNITGSNQRYQTQVANISSSLVASGTGFAGLSNPSEYANKSVLSVDFVITMIKNDGTAVVYGKLTSIFRKGNSGTWTADVPGTPTISDITQLSGFVGDINGGVPGITWTTPVTTSGTWQLGYTAAISSTTN